MSSEEHSTSAAVTSSQSPKNLSLSPMARVALLTIIVAGIAGANIGYLKPAAGDTLGRVLSALFSGAMLGARTALAWIALLLIWYLVSSVLSLIEPLAEPEQD